MDQLTVVYVEPRGRTPLQATGVRHEDVVAFWWGFEYLGRQVEQLSFVLLTDGFMLSRPAIFPASMQGWWYCDLVSIEGENPVLLRDLYIDVIVGPPDHPYRLLDLEEHADAMAAGAISIEQGLDGLRRTQAFLDRRLNRRQEPLQSWPDFPPRAVLDLLDADDLPRAWTWTALPEVPPS
ncbi:MAG: DUF402 domain-containing protein [Mycobacteriales bacterium]